VDRALLYSDALDGDLLEVWEMKSIDTLFSRTFMAIYFIKRKAEYNTATAKEEFSRANHTTKAKKNKREESLSRQTR
jgi:hypothetical protein